MSHSSEAEKISHIAAEDLNCDTLDNPDVSPKEKEDSNDGETNI
jgi:hypothetical protein